MQFSGDCKIVTATNFEEIEAIRPVWEQMQRDEPHPVPNADIDRYLSVVKTSGDDVRPYVRKSAISIVPLRIGGGSRLKILEALSMGKAVVSTSLGAEGLELTDGEHLLIADEPENFAGAVAELLNDPAKRKKLGENGQKLVTGKYQWVGLAEIQSKFLQEIISSE